MMGSCKPLEKHGTDASAQSLIEKKDCCLYQHSTLPLLDHSFSKLQVLGRCSTSISLEFSLYSPEDT